MVLVVVVVSVVFGAAVSTFRAIVVVVEAAGVEVVVV